MLMTRAVTVRGVPFLRLPDTMALLPSTRDSTRARTSDERSFRSRARPSAVGKGGQPGLRHCYSTGHGECAAEAVERRSRITGRPALEPDDAVVAEAVQRRRDRRIVDLAGARLAAPGDVGDLDLADRRQRALDQRHEI